MFDVQILIPRADNAGRRFSDARHREFEGVAVALFGGVSRFPGEVAGAWHEAGVVYRDRTRVFAVALGSIVNGAKVGELATFAKTHYDQKAIYVRYLTLAEVL